MSSAFFTGNIDHKIWGAVSVMMEGISLPKRLLSKAASGSRDFAARRAFTADGSLPDRYNCLRMSAGFIFAIRRAMK